MFSWHPQIAVETYLDLRKPCWACFSNGTLCFQIDEQLNFVHEVATRGNKKSAENNKWKYDLKILEATLVIGSHVLIRNVGLRGEQKLSGAFTVNIIHRHMLLPFLARPGISELSMFQSDWCRSPWDEEMFINNKFRVRSNRMYKGAKHTSNNSTGGNADKSITFYDTIHNESSCNLAWRKAP